MVTPSPAACYKEHLRKGQRLEEQRAVRVKPRCLEGGKCEMMGESQVQTLAEVVERGAEHSTGLSYLQERRREGGREGGKERRGGEGDTWGQRHSDLCQREELP
ncbi:hypothetical protein EYF80_037053 [Liparis tanakae]|uniref:Uncharacterized protein n=1 Tax=Liparis tanakae TaxID=230148 RepID=A0A4Z2GH53_9TELE|nr:hypothetical protein EYF80_037053 [Liparis tanakae]